MAFLEFKNYHNLIEDLLLNEEIKLREAYDEDEIIKLSKEKGEFSRAYANHLQESFFERNMEISVNYPHNFRSSFFVQLISFVEYELRKICEFHHYSNKENLEPIKNWGNDDLESTKEYLKKFAELKINNLNPEWGFIKTAKEIRNKFVHHHCKILKSDNKWQNIETFIKKRNSINFREAGIILESAKKRGHEIKEFTIILSGKEINEELLEKVQSFFKKLLEVELKIL